jgi:hypothetical protein
MEYLKKDLSTVRGKYNEVMFFAVFANLKPEVIVK